MVASFQFTSTPNIEFGSGKVRLLPSLIERYGSNLLLITGSSSFTQSDQWDKLLLQLESAKIHWFHFVVDTEPTPAIIDNCIKRYADKSIEVIAAIGGGSVMDAGKAISAMFCQPGSVRDYLEGVGIRKPSRQKIPFIAVPTTSGTGSEATKNAVISEVGEKGFKRSLRNDNYVPDLALVDPMLTLNCPLSITAQSGMAAFSQLLESYVSSSSNPMTDSLAVEGIRKIRDGLLGAASDGQNLELREYMSYASLISGITLANAGLGTVHGFASSIGGFFDIPHGLVCARMMEPVNRITIEKMRKTNKFDRAGLLKFARIGKLFCQDKNASDDYYIDLLLEILQKYTAELKIVGLGEYGIKTQDFERIISKTSNKNNPIALDKDELKEALSCAL